MTAFSYDYHFKKNKSNVVLFFPDFPEIQTTWSSSVFDEMFEKDIQDFATDQVLRSLQKRISEKTSVPKGRNADLARASGVVMLSVVQAMKLVFIETCQHQYGSIAELGRRLKRDRSYARRLLDVRQRSRAEDLESAMALYGYRFTPTFGVEPKFMPDKTRISRHALFR